MQSYDFYLESDNLWLFFFRFNDKTWLFHYNLAQLPIMREMANTHCRKNLFGNFNQQNPFCDSIFSTQLPTCLEKSQ